MRCGRHKPEYIHGVYEFCKHLSKLLKTQNFKEINNIEFSMIEVIVALLYVVNI